MNWYWVGVAKVGREVILCLVWIVILLLPIVLAYLAESRPGKTWKDGLLVAVLGYGLYLLIGILAAPLFMAH
jgi:hypothetical protein